jgi:hypothetical protein
MPLLISACLLFLFSVVLPQEINLEGSDQKTSTHSVFISNNYFSGTILDNFANKKRQGSGFNPLKHKMYSERNIFRDDAVGLNFEHIMNGSAVDADKCMFTPRIDSCTVRLNSDSSASIIHRAEDSYWNIDSELKYTFVGEHYIDLEFNAVLREDKFPLDYIAFMWASYMNSAVDRRFHFLGYKDNRKDWIAFGEDNKNGFETGTVAYYKTDSLRYEKKTKTLNIIENKNKTFVLPFYYGLVYGAGAESVQDTMVYIMMFDQKEAIRFAMWNFFRTADGKADTHSPAWDWQYVIRSPQINKPYKYSARIVYKPFKGRSDVLEEYKTWNAKMRVSDKKR